jgi:NDP-sugar pyrophosphorylase family protein
MYPVGIRPFLEYSIRNLLRSGIVDPAHDRLGLIVGHHADQVRSYFGNAYDGLPIVYIDQPQALGTGHALHCANQALRPQQPIIAWLADLYVPPAVFRQVAHHSLDNVQTIAPGPADENPKVRVTVTGDRIATAWCGQDALYDIGLWKLSPQVLALLTTRQVDEYRVLPNLQYALENGIAVGYVQTDAWIHLGGTQPTVTENVRDVVARVLELENA